ncbi:MAG: 30S ribosomal protein S7 [Candidatus Omnitrophica bacterium]|jgi:small subunit ribosomal protein S7|nr:30S ribosomal protein S7 [Candidatus Omnitrophota bacterium]
MRRRRAEKRRVLPDPKYKSEMVSKFINIVMERGKKATAETIVYDAFEILKEKAGKPNILELFQQVLDNVRPMLELKSRRVGGATYQVPVEVTQARGIAIAMRWLRNFARQRKGGPMSQRLGGELVDAYQKQGSAIKKREDTHKMAEANKAFSHFKW